MEREGSINLYSILAKVVQVLLKPSRFSTSVYQFPGTSSVYKLFDFDTCRKRMFPALERLFVLIASGTMP